MSYFLDDQWYCECRTPARWYESKQPGSKGQLFARCPKSRETGCRFFMWENDEPAERLARLSAARRSGAIPMTPQTVRRHTDFGTITNSAGLPTPGTGDSTTRRSGHSPSTIRESSPTPQQRRNGGPMKENTAGNNPNKGLFEDIVALLRSENIVIKDSTKAKLREVIDLKVGMFEEKMGLFQSAFSELSDRLATVDIRGVR